MIDAARLAAAAPPGGVLSPTDESAEFASLDLRQDGPSVAASKARAVATALGPRLCLQASFRLAIACGELPPSAVASWFAAAGEGVDGGQIAVVRGEDLIDRLEELMLAGCDLGAMDPPPVAAWASPPVGTLREAAATGASVMVSRFAEPSEVSEAIRVEATAEPVVSPQVVAIELFFVDRYELTLEGDTCAELEAVLKAVPMELTAPCSVGMSAWGESARLVAACKELAALRELAQRLDLAAPVGMLRRPAAETITPCYRRVKAEVPSGLLDFGVEVRSAGDWLYE